MSRYALPLSILALAAAILWTGMPAAQAQTAPPKMVCGGEVMMTSVGTVTSKRLEEFAAWSDQQVAAGRTHLMMYGLVPCAW